VSHDQQFGYQVADRMVSLNSGQLVDLHQDASCCAPLLAQVSHAARAMRSSFDMAAAL
jgi:ABC-type sulfate/molybdate transport systems ATPase subunit